MSLIEEPVKYEAKRAQRLFFIRIAADYGPESNKLLPPLRIAANDVDPEVAGAARAVIQKILKDYGGSDYSEHSY